MNLDVRLKSTQSSLFKLVLIERATAPLLTMHTSSTSPKTHCKDSGTNYPPHANGSNVIKVYYFLLLSSVKYVLHQQPALLQYETRGPRVTEPSVSHGPSVVTQHKEKEQGKAHLEVFEGQAYSVTYHFCSHFFSHKARLNHQEPRRRKKKRDWWIMNRCLPSVLAPKLSFIAPPCSTP